MENIIEKQRRELVEEYERIRGRYKENGPVSKYKNGKTSHKSEDILHNAMARALERVGERPDLTGKNLLWGALTNEKWKVTSKHKAEQSIFVADGETVIKTDFLGLSTEPITPLVSERIEKKVSLTAEDVLEDIENNLTEKYKRLFRLRFFDGLTQNEVAEKLKRHRLTVIRQEKKLKNIVKNLEIVKSFFDDDTIEESYRSTGKVPTKLKELPEPTVEERREMASPVFHPDFDKTAIFQWAPPKRRPFSSEIKIMAPRSSPTKASTSTASGLHRFLRDERVPPPESLKRLVETEDKPKRDINYQWRMEKVIYNRPSKWTKILFGDIT